MFNSCLLIYTKIPFIIQFKCCGVKSYQDWFHISAWPDQEWVPSSCCLPKFSNMSACGQMEDIAFLYQSVSLENLKFLMFFNIFLHINIRKNNHFISKKLQVFFVVCVISFSTLFKIYCKLYHVFCKRCLLNHPAQGQTFALIIKWLIKLTVLK